MAQIKTNLAYGVTGTIPTANIADDAITSAKLADDSVVAAAIADNAVVTAAINADAITAAKVADDAINSEHLVDGGVDDAHLATGISSSKLSGALPAISGASLTGVSAGKILQVQSATSNTTFDMYSTTELTTLSCAITPSATSSKVLIMFSVPRAENSDPTQDGAKRIRYFLLRGSTKIFTGGQDSSFSVTSGGDANHETISGMVVDSPSTTSATTYNINFNVNTATTNGRWNRANTNYAGTMSIVLMEIDGS